MDNQQTYRQKVVAIVPAFNEAARIGAVLDVLCSFPLFSQVIVVDDGSTDDTEAVARGYPVHFIRNTKNVGKARAVDIGVRACDADILFFCDADVKGLTHDIIRNTLTPVLSHQVDMFVAMRNRKVYFFQWIVPFVPLLGGERALRPELWFRVPEFYKFRFRIEAALNFYAKYYGHGFDMKVFPGLSQTIKEKKYGILLGLRHRGYLFWDVFVASLRLHFVHIPPNVRNVRASLWAIFLAFLGVVLGVLVLVGVWYGPREFVLRLFARELAQDPDAPFVWFLLNITSIFSVRSLFFIGCLLALVNSLFFILRFATLTQVLRQNKMKISHLFWKLKPENDSLQRKKL